LSSFVIGIVANFVVVVVVDDDGAIVVSGYDFRNQRSTGSGWVKGSSRHIQL